MALGINLGLFRTSLLGSAASGLVRGYSSSGDGLAMTFEGSPSIYVKDSTTPANDTSLTLSGAGLDTFSDFLTYTSPHVKNVMQADGTIKYAAHNLLPDSEAFEDWTIQGNTVVDGGVADPLGGTNATT